MASDRLRKAIDALLDRWTDAISPRFEVAGGDLDEPREAVIAEDRLPTPEPSPRELAIRELEELRDDLVNVAGAPAPAWAIQRIDARLAKLREVRL